MVNFMKQGEIIMKDYSLNRKDSESFILSYTIEDGNIVAKTASGELLQFHIQWKMKIKYYLKWSNKLKWLNLNHFH